MRAGPNPESTGNFVPAASKHEILGVQAIFALQNFQILRVFAVKYLFPAVYIPRNTARPLSTRVVSSERSLQQLPLVRLSGCVLCPRMGLIIVDTVPRQSKYSSYSKDTRYFEGITVLLSTRTSSTNTTNGRNTAINRLVLAVPAVYNPCTKQGVSTTVLQELCIGRVVRGF